MKIKSKFVNNTVSYMHYTFQDANNRENKGLKLR